eukprot:7440469-Ditylum_brightwellii.AAC.1
MQQQMKQREEEKADRDQQMHLVRMERNATEQACKERESQRERHHQDFMMMMMVMVTGSKSPKPSISPFPPSNFLTPTKKVVEEDKLEEDIAKETVLHDT